MIVESKNSRDFSLRSDIYLANIYCDVRFASFAHSFLYRFFPRPWLSSFAIPSPLQRYAQECIVCFRADVSSRSKRRNQRIPTHGSLTLCANSNRSHRTRSKQLSKLYRTPWFRTLFSWFMTYMIAMQKLVSRKTIG